MKLNENWSQVIRYIPTLTSLQWSFNGISNYTEILLTPNDTFKGVPDTFLGDVIIDNGGFRINRLRGNERLVFEHIERCSRLEKDPRYIFILPDVVRDHDFSLATTGLFLREVRPERIAQPYLSAEYVRKVEQMCELKPEFYCVSPLLALTMIDEIEPPNFHLFGRVDPKIFKDFRSYDSFGEFN